MLVNFIAGWALLSIITAAFWCCVFHNSTESGASE